MKFLDLSYSLSNTDKSNWPGNSPFRLTTISESDQNPMGCFLASFDITMDEHVGTHMDAPYHFNSNGWKVDQIPLEKLINVPGVVVDISAKCHHDSQAKLEASDLEIWVKTHGPLPSQCMVLLRSGWGQYYYSDPVKFIGTDKNDEDFLSFPGFGKSGIDWLLQNTDFVGIGVDTLSIELGRTQKCYVHRSLTAKNKYGLECLANLDQLPPKDFYVTVLPLKIQGGSGGPCRVVASLQS